MRIPRPRAALRTDPESRLRAQITENLAEGVCAIRWHDAHVVYANRRMEAMFAVAPGSLVGRDSREFEVVGADREALDAECRATLAADGHWSGELQYRRRDGTSFWGHATLSSFEHPEHGPLSLLVLTDVTEQRAAERGLEEERRMLAETQAVGRIGSWERSLDGVVRWSAQNYVLHGLHPGDGPPSTEEYLALVHPDDRAALRAAIDDDAGAYTVDYRFHRPGCGWCTLRVRGARLPAAADRPERLAGTCQDITAEHRAHAAQEQFRRSFQDALIGMIILDLDQRFVEVNDAFCRIVGRSREALESASHAEITHPGDRAHEARALQALQAGATTSYTREKRFVHGNGHTVWATVSLTVVRDAHGEPMQIIGQAQDITERRRYERQLRHMADHDALTGLLNRRSFERELAGHVRRTAREQATGAVLLIDLDHFKYYNDRHGHNAGDQLIVRIADALRLRLRGGDVLARLGGDEFAVLLPCEDAAGAHDVADALARCVRSEALPIVAGDGGRVTASIGIACIADGERLGAEELLVNADLAMYDAKEDGRDRIAHAHDEEAGGGQGGARMASRMKWAEQITHAIATDGFELVAQPIVALAGGGATAQFELLLRMRDTDASLIPPGAFLPVAERLGLIQTIDRWVTDRAIAMLAETRAQGHDLRLEVNLSGHTLGDQELLELVERRLAETGVPADRLIFEVTETAAVAHIAQAASFAERLSQLGCQFALDDFGAGFGSFYYLKHLPFDYLKIDGEFVRQCVSSATDRLLIASVVQIARGMGKKTIAEFVDSDEVVAVLAGLGVDHGQGFHLGRPEPLEQHLGAPAPVRAA